MKDFANNSQITISVLITSYNYGEFIEKAINSVINQSYPDWELIIVDDGSSDNSLEIIESFCRKDFRIKFFQHEDAKNKGLKESILLGLEKAQGEWIAFLESDDFWDKDNLLKKMEVVKNYPQIGLIFNKVEIISDKNEDKRKLNLEKVQNLLEKQAFPKDMFYDFFIINKILTFSCVMVNKNILKPSYFNTPNDARLDWWLWIHLAFETMFYYINEELTIWHLHNESYIKRDTVSPFYLIQAKAYCDIYNKNKKDFKLLLFILSSHIQWSVIKTLKFFRIL